ncbi:hypothetical protein ACODT3_25030 [Streptomyces sp. 4.24]|uniref:hypothetical protein n=1 Tax=Streptomyces tritrimontium TaxID=3406573 RepID=UPI003BB77EEB
MQIIDLAEQTRLLGQVAPALNSLRNEVNDVQAGEISKPVREIAPVAIRAQELSMRCTQQLSLLSTSQYAAMKDGPENLAELAEAGAQVALAATLCTFAIHRRTEMLLYEGADETPETSRRTLNNAAEELDRAARTYNRQARRLSHRLASFTARREDHHLIARALATSGGASGPKGHTALAEVSAPAVVTAGTPAPISPKPLGALPLAAPPRQR